MTTTAAAIQALEAQHVLQTYKRQPVVFVRGEGCAHRGHRGPRATSTSSRASASSVLGHGHPGLARAVAEQAAALLHTSNLYFHPLQGQVAARLAALVGTVARVLLQQRHRGDGSVPQVRPPLLVHPGRPRAHPLRRLRARLLGPHDGRAVGHRQPALPRALRAADPGRHLRAARRRRGARRGGVVGDGGHRRRADPGRRRRAPDRRRSSRRRSKRACTRTGALLIADEVQCGLGRTGAPFYFQTLGLTPDLVTVGKALGAGVPVGAALVADEVAAQVLPGDHGTTYGGNLLATRAALFVLEQLQDHGAARPGAAHRRRTSRPRSAPSPRRHPVITEVRGRRPDARAAARRGCRAGGRSGAGASGLLVNRTAETVVRLLPPYIGDRGGHRRGGGDTRRRAGRPAGGGEDDVSVDLVDCAGPGARAVRGRGRAGL